MKYKNIKNPCLIISLLFIVSLCVTIYSSFSNKYNNKEDEELIGTYIDGEYSENIPNKDTGYVVEKIVCDNNAVGKWDYDNWGITLTNLSEKNKCNIYFKKGVKLADIINLVDTTGKCPTVNDDGAVNVTSAETENSLLCSAPDNYGNSYYFRGNVQNNYVKFANFYWRIVRINGDNSIRMIYDGTSTHANGETSDDRIIGTSAFNEKSDDNAYVGYMYGTTGSSTYEETHANINDSTIKKYIDNWYENNLKDYSQYLTDNIFCNERSISSKLPAEEYNNLGYGNNNTAYKWFYSFGFGPAGQKNQDLSENLVCINKNDSFTQSDGVKGNSNLKYPIGLITMDELSLAGGYNTINNNYYLKAGVNYWTMTPCYIFENSARNHYVFYDGRVNYDNHVYVSYGVKPVINLKPNSLKSGDGTMNNPYTVE